MGIKVVRYPPEHENASINLLRGEILSGGGKDIFINLFQLGRDGPGPFCEMDDAGPTILTILGSPDICLAFQGIKGPGHSRLAYIQLGYQILLAERMLCDEVQENISFGTA